MRVLTQYLSRKYKLYPWLVWSLAAAFFFYKYLLQVSPSVMLLDLGKSFNASGASLGNLAACFFYAYLVMQIPVGLLLDRYSPKILTLGALITTVLGTFLFAHSHTLLQAGLARALIGLGASFAAVSCLKLTTLWFKPKYFALVSGLSMTAAMLGAIGGQIPLSYLMKYYSWQNTTLIVAVFGIVIAILFWIFVQDESTLKIQHQVHVRIKKRSLFESLFAIVRLPQTWLLSLYSGLAFAPVSVFGGLWGNSFLIQVHHLSSNQAASAISMIFLGFAIGCPIAGWLSDFICRRKQVMLMGTLVAITSLSVVLYLPFISVSMLTLLLFLFGLGGSCFFVCFSMMREINSFIFAATALGFMNTFDSIVEAMSEPAIGKLLDLGWQGEKINGARYFSAYDYHWSLSLLVVYLAVALITLLFIKETYCQQSIE